MARWLIGTLDPTQYIAGGGVVGLASLLCWLVWRVLRMNDAQIDNQLEPAWEEIRKLREANNACERRVWKLVRSLREHGIDVPLEVWDDD